MLNLSLSLTDTLCARAEPGQREYAMRDTRLPGLALRVQPGGSRSWIVRASVDGKAVRRSLGSFPEIGVKAARASARAFLAGETLTPAKPPAVPHFATFQIEHEQRCGAFYKPQGLRTYRTYVRCELLPAFGHQRLDAISRQDVVRWFEGYSLRRPGGANRALGILVQMLGRARAWGYMPDGSSNPAKGIRMNRRKVVGTFLGFEEMARLGGVLDQRIKAGCTASALLRFLTVTGCRVSEAVNLEWQDIYPDRLRLRDSKTGSRDIPLGAPVRRFLKSYRANLQRKGIGGLRHVFPLLGRQHYEGVRSIWGSIRREAELPPTLRIHDLRHSFASHAVMSGETLFTTSRLLGHSRVQMTARYAHLADDVLMATCEKLGRLLIAQTR
ncbi:site-specific integrase [Sphingobium sp. HWE2-09]|uniref:site-specific integrase n=1 Tax=Sphingobium sp. HWE2-09 TaxID=3108390 RepID=UPI002DD2B1A1|nr:site-specific integrase [Sphingobium sp. HWE2-09]